MDIFFQDPTAVPLPPKEVRIKELKIQPHPDHKRIHVFLEITPFQKRPNGEITISNPSSEEVASVSIIETIDTKMEFTLHLRGSTPKGEYTVNAMLFYIEMTNGEGDATPDYSSDELRTVVDETQITFQLSPPDA